MNMIKPTSFYSSKEEKTKLNWFCYEMSMGFYDELRENLGRRLRRYRIDEDALAAFSIYLSKAMKDIILQQLSGEIEHVQISYKMIESYYPNLSDRMVNRMLDIILKAWKKQLDFCVVCPTRCISEKDMYCFMFDDKSLFR